MTDPTGLLSQEAPLNGHRRRSGIWIVGIIGVLVVVFLLLRVFVLNSWIVNGSSMSPTYDNGDRIIVNRLAGADVNDIVVVRADGNDGSRDFVKRVVAIGGDTLVYEGCVLTVNGEVRTELFLGQSTSSCGGDQPSTIVPNGHVYVLGDNRGGSQDSRSLGTFSTADILGVVVFEL